MSESYERERQNNSRLDELSAKVSALRGVTVDIYDNARAQDVIDNTVRHHNPPSFERHHYPPCPQSTRGNYGNISNANIAPSPIPSPPCATP